MNLPSPAFSLRGLLAAFHRDQRGTSLTEFAITLPIYLILLVGLLNLYHLHQNALMSVQRSTAEMWDDAIQTQRFPWRAEVMPATAAISTGLFYNSVGEFPGFYSGIDVSAAAGGLYTDSWMKAGAMNQIPNVNVSPDPKRRLNQIVCNPSHAHSLMNDQADFRSLNFGSFGNFINSLAGLSGTRPAIAAGIRYGTVEGSDRTTFGPSDGRFQAEALTYSVASAPTMPSDHLFGVVFTRLEMGTESGWRDMIVFGNSNLGSGMSDVGGCP